MARVSHRLERVARELQREIGNILLNEAGDMRLHFVSITRVEVAPDLRTAKVFFSVIGETEAQEDCIQALERARNFIQRKISARLKMRFTPILSFHKDASIEGSIDICKVIDSVVAAEPEKLASDATEDTGPETEVENPNLLTDSGRIHLDPGSSESNAKAQGHKGEGM